VHRKWSNWYQNEVDEEIKGVDSTNTVKHSKRVQTRGQSQKSNTEGVLRPSTTCLMLISETVRRVRTRSIAADRRRWHVTAVTRRKRPQWERYFTLPLKRWLKIGWSVAVCAGTADDHGRPNIHQNVHRRWRDMEFAWYARTGCTCAVITLLRR